MGSRKKQKRRAGEPKVDEHHILYSHQEWNNLGRWGKLLRNHPYYRKIIPIKSLHRSIHAQIKLIPPPDNLICKDIYNATIEAIDRNEIDADYDTIENRIDFFLTQLIKYRDQDYSETINALLLQREIVAKYYCNNRTKKSLYRPKTPYQDRYESFSILYPAKTWGAKGYGKVLSENSYFIVRIPQGLADKIRKDVRFVSKPKNGSCLKLVNQQLEHARKDKEISPRFDSFETRIQFLINAFYKCSEYDTCASLERMLTAVTEYYKRHT